MIIGIGTDIIDIRRIENTIKKYGEKFKKKCFTINEINRSESRLKVAHSYAKKYAAKEACFKALSTGLANQVFWKDIEILNNKFGKPSIVLHNNAKSKLEKISKKKCNILVSISDEKNYAISNVIIFEK